MWGNFEPAVRLLQNNFLVVTFNYRLGALGFLCLGTIDVPGNAGLKDQVAALYWIQKNIAKFGGNPLDVTVHGTGAGAAAVELVLLSGVASGLLDKVILESGSALSPVSITYDPVQDAIEAARTIGYEGSDDVKDLLVFYSQVDALKLGNVGKMFLPCIEKNHTGGILTIDPREILGAGNFQKVPMLITYTNRSQVTEADNNTFDHEPDNFDQLLPTNLNFESNEMRSKVAELVKDFYFGENRRTDSSVLSYLGYFHDTAIEYPVMKTAVFHAATSSLPVYLMKFTRQGDIDNKLENISGTDDHIILEYLYAKDHLNNADEQAVSKLVAIWTNFIKIGDPTPLTSALIPVVWQPIRINKKYELGGGTDITSITGLEFGTTLTLSESLSSQHLVFWDNIYKKFYRQLAKGVEG